MIDATTEDQHRELRDGHGPTWDSEEGPSARSARLTTRVLTDHSPQWGGIERNDDGRVS